MRKKLLFISRNLPPLVGGMEKLAHRLHDGLATKYQVILIGPKGCSKWVGANTKTIEISANPVIFMTLATVIACFVASRNRLHACIGANGLIAPICFLLKKIFAVPSLVLVHGLDLTAPNRIYQYGIIPLIRRTDRIIANSAATRNIALDKGIPERSITIVNPGVDYPPDKSLGENIDLGLNPSVSAMIYFYST